MKALLPTLLVALFNLPFLNSTAQEGPMSAFDKLVNKTWTAQGTWNNGGIFKQEVTFEYSLNNQIVMARSRGFTDRESTEFGLRNVGIRQFDSTLGKAKFWEFDVFGGLTEGSIQFDGPNISYKYAYGDSEITDHWQYINDSTYRYTVGQKDGDKWAEVYLETHFQLISSNIPRDFPDLINRLPGSWSAPAWGGTLNETWNLGSDGHLHQKAQYIEDDKVLYEARSKIERVGNEWVLFTVIVDNNPKIFKATSYSKEHITFENNEYSNPNKVTYFLDGKGQFKRTISGVEGGDPTSTTFSFQIVGSNN